MSILLPLLLQTSLHMCGTWRFYAYIYEGQQIAAPNPDLYEVLEFQEPDVLRLYYKRDDEDGFCERKAHYQFDNTNLQQQVFWVNPDNQPACAQDPDMVNNQNVTNKANVQDGVLYLELPLGDGNMTTLWRLEEGDKACQTPILM